MVCLSLKTWSVTRQQTTYLNIAFRICQKRLAFQDHIGVDRAPVVMELFKRDVIAFAEEEEKLHVWRVFHDRMIRCDSLGTKSAE